MQPGNEPAGLIRDPEEQVFLTGATLQPLESLSFEDEPFAVEFAPSQVMKTIRPGRLKSLSCRSLAQG